MNTTELIENTNFHDSSLVELSMVGNHIHLRFENVWVDDDNCYKVLADLHGVRKVNRNDEVVHSLGMEGEYAGVIDFERSGHTAALAVDWRSFSPPRDDFCSYEFDFDTFEMQAEKQEPPA
ncbi:MAG: hypothetical protein P4M09_11000 [Devosia sp.]|nr:hypothetical protein [Devosia sp.]